MEKLLSRSIIKMSGTFRENEEVGSMDSNALEQERGITILAKTTAIDYKGVRINILGYTRTC